MIQHGKAISTTANAQDFNGDELVNYTTNVEAIVEPLTVTDSADVLLTSSVSLIVTTKPAVGALADGYAGQIITIIMKTDGGDYVLTPANLIGTTITFDGAGEYAKLLFDGTNWCPIGATATIA